MRKVYSHENLAVLNMAKNVLEHNGIDCFVKNEYHASGGHVGWAAIPIELWVYDSEQEGNAAALLEKELNPCEKRVEWRCKHCDEENDGSFETCWKCQRAPDKAP